MHHSEAIEDRNLAALRPLPPPRDVKAALPLTDAAASTVLAGRAAIRDVLHGRDTHRLVVIVGPCSIHDPDAALDYARRLRRVADATRDSLVLVMRTYFEKPRTTVGWKGLINDPLLDGSCDLPAGLHLARRILLDINGMGIACAGEMLDPIVPQYIADLLSWVAIGARTTESQTHREMASGLSMPVGFKNGTDGGLQVALNAMISARHPHSFLGIDRNGAVSVVQTTGNPDRHIVLRGGAGDPNYGPEAIARAARLLADEAIARPIMIDCSHDNSGKDHQRQGAVCRAVAAQVRDGEGRVLGLMLESNLQPGRQNWMPDERLAYGVSITDACIGWDETEALLHELADSTPRRRAA
ncbi:3-deoxy-7-phosphoheptulonate synthase [bacterium]|nr:3-deoxy-7-phosphoheptulonate synthase [bacterium]